MSHKLSFTFSLFLLLAACTSVEPTPTPEPIAAVLEVTAVPPTRTVPPTATPLPTGTAVVTHTATPIMSPTSTSTLEPTTVTIPCQNPDTIPDKAFPTNLDVVSSHLAVDKPYIYLGVEQYIGVFDISAPETPEFLGFWEFPDLPELSDIEAHNGAVYVSSGSTLHMMNSSLQCQLGVISEINLPFQISRLEIEGDRVYVGGYSEDREQLNVAVLSIEVPAKPRELGTVYLEPAIWSVVGQDLYSFGVDELFVTDVSDPTKVQTQLANTILDPTVFSRYQSQFIEDTLYLLSDIDGFSIISNLKDPSPGIRQNPKQYILVGIFEVQENYAFLGYLGCEGGEVDCSSVAYILNADNGEELAKIAFHPYGNIYKYQEIQEDIIYAFSNDSLFVVDISEMDDPTIIRQVQLTEGTP